MKSFEANAAIWWGYYDKWNETISVSSWLFVELSKLNS